MKFYFVLLFSFCSLAVWGQLAVAVSKFRNTPCLKYASIGICIKEIPSSKIIASHNKNTALVPASTLKLLTSATALEILGQNYRFKTELALDKKNPQNIIIHGYGDPTLGSEHVSDQPDFFLSQWAGLIKQKIKTNKPANIYVADNYFGYKGISRKWTHEDLGNYFAAAAYGISVFDNTYKLEFNTMRRDTCPLIVKTEPSVEGLHFLNTLQMNAEGKDNGYICGEPFSYARTLIGDIPAGRKSFSIKGDIPDPGFTLAKYLADKLQQQGLKIAKIETSRKLYLDQINSKQPTQAWDEDVFYTQLSPTLKDIVKVVNVKSNNHYTEHLMRAIGRTKNEDIYSDPLEEGILQTASFWEAKGIDTQSMQIYDGSGLAPSNCISPQMLCDVLIYMQNKSKYAKAFLESLPKAGKEGTVRNFLKGTRLEGKLSVKSGSIAKVQCFAGYYIAGNKKYAFAVMVNNFNGSHRETVKAIETMLLSIF